MCIENFGVETALKMPLGRHSRRWEAESWGRGLWGRSGGN
jgi:hypothetical protein